MLIDTESIRGSGVVARLADQLASRATTAVALVEMSLSRIADANELNAVIATDEAGAMRDALEWDRLRVSGADLPPLAGIPALVKDNLDAIGFRTTFGSRIRRDVAPADHDDTVVTQLREAGAVFVGKTNLPEYAMEGFTDNPLWGATRNPWRDGISPGGSSGGSAAALIAGLAPIATGTDLGGSSRVPAAACGLLGIKPTSGVVGNRHARLPIEFSSAAPMAGTVADLELLLRLGTQQVLGDPSCVYGLLDNDRDKVENLQIIATERVAGAAAVDPEVSAAFWFAAERFADLHGVMLTKVGSGVVPARADDDWTTICVAEDVYSASKDITAENFRLMDGRIAPLIDEGRRTTLHDYLAARGRRNDYTRILDDMLNGNVLLLTPTLCTPSVPLRGAADGLPVPIDAYNTAVFNLTGHPSISVPAGYIDGSPFGMQVVGARGRDLALLRSVRRWEESEQWPLCAPGFSPFIP